MMVHMSTKISSTALLFLLCVAAAGSAQPGRGTSELTLMVGASMLDVSEDEDAPFTDFLDLSAVDLPGSSPLFRFRGLFGPGGPFGAGTLVLPNVIRERRELGRSVVFGARYGYYVADRVVVEADFALAPEHTVRREYSFNCPDNRVCILAGLDAPLRLGETTVNAYHYGAGAGFDLTGGRWRPMVLAGLGGVTYSADGGSETNVVVRVGGGIKGYLERLGIRAEVLDHLIVDHFLTGAAEHDLQVRGGVFVHW
jgi:hypothetical protein